MHPQALLSQEWIEEAEKLGLSRQDAESEFAQFRDYWLAQAGAKAVKVDWLAAWRMWIRNALKFQRRPSGRGGGGRRMSAAEFMAAREAALHGADND